MTEGRRLVVVARARTGRDVMLGYEDDPDGNEGWVYSDQDDKAYACSPASVVSASTKWIVAARRVEPSQRALAAIHDAQRD